MVAEQSEQREGDQQRGLDLKCLKEGGAGVALHGGVRDGATGRGRFLCVDETGNATRVRCGHEMGSVVSQGGVRSGRSEGVVDVIVDDVVVGPIV